MVLLSVVFNYDDAIRLSAFPSLLTYVAVNRWSTVIYDNHLTPRNRMSRGYFQEIIHIIVVHVATVTTN